LKVTSKTVENSTDDGLKGLTFNVHLNSDDIEAKKNLVLPYEIIKLFSVLLVNFFKRLINVSNQNSIFI
jgi:hypothetical protein